MSCQACFGQVSLKISDDLEILTVTWYGFPGNIFDEEGTYIIYFLPLQWLDKQHEGILLSVTVVF